ncbi:acetylornithine deacetylase [Roseospira visakhapatnamensis]|uniref:Acetylornithine deacetylase n=1 Tax=Roseospira visakhapatnamensis TaxID=390880 RepID=A0A7W6RBM4_9PROT|nr:acetylornithine deacetylase [Roseospira visakhapatnamensis]MBB4265377.1 acetylornithine deacetylase [Roseospira visakhapatnamensis]
MPPHGPAPRPPESDARARGIAMIARLVGFDTTSRESNLGLIHFVRDHLAAHDIPSTLVPNADGTKANLFATIGPDAPGGVVLSGHTDVVPVDGQPWDTDPFILTERDGHLYGRGTADMKSFSAIALALLPEMLAADLKRPIHLALSYDEEVGCLGAPAMIRAMAETLPPVRAVIVGEPTEMRVVGAHKGIRAWRTSVTGREAHSSQPHRGINAVMVAGRLVAWLARQADDRADHPRADSLFDPPWSTISCGVIQGGTALNILARSCFFVWETRSMPEDDPGRLDAAFRAECARLEQTMRAQAPETGIETTLLAAAPALRLEPDSEADRLVRSITGDNTTSAVAFAAEAGQFQEAGFSTILCGPGSIDQAHQPNEFITVAQVEAGIAFLRGVIARQAAP